MYATEIETITDIGCTTLDDCTRIQCRPGQKNVCALGVCQCVDRELPPVASFVVEPNGCLGDKDCV